MNGSANYQSFSKLPDELDSNSIFQFKSADSASTANGSSDQPDLANSGKAESGVDCPPVEEGFDYYNEEKELEEERSVGERGLGSKTERSGESHFQFVGQTSAADKEDATECRKFTKLMYDPKVSQQKRREAALEWQRKRRDDILDKIRQLEGDSAYSDSEPEEAEDFVKLVSRNQPSKEQALLEERDEETVEQMDTASVSSKKKSKHRNRRPHQREGQRRLPPCRVMLSEWLIQKPDDLEDNWLALFCPVGKRCLVVASRGKTKVFSRSDDCMGVYQSLLPGGRKTNYRDPTHNRSRGVTILDCIWSEETRNFYVLDIVCWNSHSCNNCDTEYRQFFLISKLSENPELLGQSSLNPLPFIPLPTFSCDQLPEVLMSSLPIFPEKVDGLLLYHKQSFYISETNPLCLWVYLTDVERRLSISVSPELMDRQKKHRKKKESVSNNKAMELDGYRQ